MAEIFPFRAYRYNAARVQPAEVLTQPYDKITPAMQERYYAASPYNLIAVEKGKAEQSDNATRNVYTRARQALDSWMAAEILIPEPAPAIYAYFQQFTLPGTRENRTRRGFIALGRVEDYAAGVVHRHEHTLSGPRADRLELLRHTCAHTGQLFMLYRDPQRRMDVLLDGVAAAAPAVDLRDEYGVVHCLWPVTDPSVTQQFVAAMAGKKLVIADGHHRYETAVAYRDECRTAQGCASPSAPYEKVMMTFVNSESEGLTIFPTHRVLAGVPGFSADALLRTLAPWFDVRAFDATGVGDSARPEASGLAAFRQALLVARAQRAIGLYAGGSFRLLTLKPHTKLAALVSEVSPAQLQLDVVLLHRVILEKGLGITPEAVSQESHIRYEREMENAVSAVNNNSTQACFLLNAVAVQQVMEMALAGEVLPQKSTDFYPKMLSGIAIYRLEE